MMEDSVFQKLYNQLNPEQKEAVDTFSGPVMVVAGPGTGKTQVLTLRIANILIQSEAREGTIRYPVKPEEILALTFTESGVAAMRKRLLEILGPRAYYIPINTFHAFCNDVIGDNPDEFPQFFDKKVVDEISTLQVLENIIKTGDFKILRPFGDKFMYVVPLLRTFSEMKREGVGPEKLLKLIAEEEEQFENIEDLYHEKGAHKGKMKGKYGDFKRNIEKNKDLAKAYAGYQEKLLGIGYDYDDIILQVVERLEGDDALLQRLQEKYKYLLADEHQDTNRAQNSVLELLCAHRKNPNIFVVGDEKQSIYRFQGANLANFLFFHYRFPSAKIITLKKNYRSSQKILDAAANLAGNNFKNSLRILQNTQTALVAKSERGGRKVRVYSFGNRDSENYFIAHKIKKLIAAGVDAREVAVFYRDNRDAFPIRDMLEKKGVPVRIESAERLLLNSDMQNLFLLIKAVSDFGSSEALAQALHINFLSIPALDIYKLLERRGESLFDILRSKNHMRGIRVSRSVRLNNFYKKLLSWNTAAHNKSAPQVFDKIVHDSGFLDFILKKADYIEGVSRLRSLHSLAKRLASENRNYTLKDFVRHLEIIEERGISQLERKFDVRRSAVRLMTAHRAKGLEFDYVFISGANMGHWGRRRTRQMLKSPIYNLTGTVPVKLGGQSLKDYEDDERRLFYVALTRAREQVYISHPRSREDGREIFPSQFIAEITDKNKAQGDSGIYERGLERNPEIFFVNRKVTRIREDEREFLRELFEKRGLSPTALNNYLECPWKYFYNSLLQIPRSKTKHEMYGTAVHASLKDLFDNLSRGKEYLCDRFEYALSREPISEDDFTESLQKGKETLAKYYENYAGRWHTNTVSEFAIKNVFLDGEVRLTGKIDKIEILDGKRVNVVDYKTGKRKTRNELDGKTRNASGNERRQLVFYKLLLDKLPDSPYIMTSGEIDFVEPEKRTEKFYKEKFEITDEDVRSLEYKIQDVTGEILGFAFWDERCEGGDRTVRGKDTKCSYCRLRECMSYLC